MILPLQYLNTTSHPNPSLKSQAVMQRLVHMAIGYVLINVQPGMEFEAYSQIKEMPNVTDATLLFGDYDILAKIEADNMGAIAKTVVENIRQVAGVHDTKTLAGAEF
ncbi:MAG: AsnC family transcriptional regulator [Methanobacteriota archaeon]|nr:MAG: AsnC family transcriptional regulator [Euryarchaeota archaeon]